MVLKAMLNGDLAPVFRSSEVASLFYHTNGTSYSRLSSSPFNQIFGVKRPFQLIQPPNCIAGTWLLDLFFQIGLVLGVVKITSHDQRQNLTALDFHFWTQPLYQVPGIFINLVQPFD